VVKYSLLRICCHLTGGLAGGLAPQLHLALLSRLVTSALPMRFLPFGLIVLSLPVRFP